MKFVSTYTYTNKPQDYINYNKIMYKYKSKLNICISIMIPTIAAILTLEKKDATSKANPKIAKPYSRKRKSKSDQ